MSPTRSVLTAVTISSCPRILQQPSLLLQERCCYSGVSTLNKRKLSKRSDSDGGKEAAATKLVASTKNGDGHNDDVNLSGSGKADFDGNGGTNECSSSRKTRMNSSSSNHRDDDGRSNFIDEGKSGQTNDSIRSNNNILQIRSSVKKSSLGRNDDDSLISSLLVSNNNNNYTGPPLLFRYLPSAASSSHSNNNDNNNYPPSNTNKNSFYSSPYYHGGGGGGGGSYRHTTILPALDASPLFDPHSFCKRSAKPSGIVTVSGTEAAKRLVSGRREVESLIANELTNRHVRNFKLYNYKKNYNNNNNNDNRGQLQQSSRISTSQSRQQRNTNNKRGKGGQPKTFALAGHGVPHQLFQDSINLADDILLKNGNAAECSFYNIHGKLMFDWMRIRSKEGNNTASAWPPKNIQLMEVHERQMWTNYQHRVELYLTVMNRLATTFGTILNPSFDESEDDSDDSFGNNEKPIQMPDEGRGSDYATHPLDDLDNDSDFDRDNDGSDSGSSSDDDFVTSTINAGATSNLYNSSYLSNPKHWNVEFLRGMAYPPTIIPSIPSFLHSRNDAVARRNQQQQQQQQKQAQSSTIMMTSPPIIELTQRRVHTNSMATTTSSSSASSPVHVRITLQGIPMKEQKFDSIATPSSTMMTTTTTTSRGGSRAGLVLEHRRKRKIPVTLVFDACF